MSLINKILRAISDVAYDVADRVETIRRASPDKSRETYQDRKLHIAELRTEARIADEKSGPPIFKDGTCPRCATGKLVLQGNVPDSLLAEGTGVYECIGDKLQDVNGCGFVGRASERGKSWS